MHQASAVRGHLAAVWFADIVGYSSISSENEKAALSLVSELQTCAREAIEEHDGRLVKFIGDAAMAEFPSAAEAVRSAGTLLRCFAERAAEKGHPAVLRVGVHVGEVVADDDGDIYGEGVNTASRIQHEARPGQVVVSEDVRRHLRGHPDFRFHPVGVRSVRGLLAPISLYTAEDSSVREERRSLWRLPQRILLEMHERRFLRVLVLYAVAGWLLLLGAQQLAERQLIPAVIFRVALIWYVGGFPILLTLGWYHWRTGRKRPVPKEFALLGLMCVALLSLSATVVRSAGEADWRFVRIGETPMDPRKMAVLYFDDLSPGGGYTYLADAFTEDLIESFEGVAGLEVISRNGVAPFRGGAVPPDSVARVLDAGTIVRGAIEQHGDGDSVRVNIRLIDGLSGADVDRAAFTLPTDQILTMRTELVERVSRLLRRWLGADLDRRERQTETDNATAWGLVQRAERLMKDAELAVEAEDLERAERHFEEADRQLEEAEAADPAWSEPSLLRGKVAYRRSRLAYDPAAALPWTERALEHAEEALAHNPRDAEALELRGTTRYWRYHLRAGGSEAAQTELLDGARADLERAVASDSTLASAYTTLAHLYYITDDARASAEATRRAYEADAYLSDADVILWRLFTSAYDLGRPDQAARWCEEGRKRFPGSFRFAACDIHLMTMPGVQPDVERAWQRLAQVDSLSPPTRRAIDRAQGMVFVGGVIARAGLPDSARAVLDRGRAARPEDADAYELAYIEAPMRDLAGDRDEALSLLKIYLESEPEITAADFEDHWWWHQLRIDPRFHQLFDNR